MQSPEVHLTSVSPNDRHNLFNETDTYLYLYNEFFDKITIYHPFSLPGLYTRFFSRFPQAERLQFKADYEIDEKTPNLNGMGEINGSYTPDSSSCTIKAEEKVIIHITGIGVYIAHNKDICIKKYIDFFKENLRFLDRKSSFFIIYKPEYSPEDFALRPTVIKDSNTDIRVNYNSDILPVDKAIREFLNSKLNGLVLLHGVQGSGKTSYIRYLIKNINKRFIYMPLHLAASLDDTRFISFLFDYPDSILIIEDCEHIIKSRESEPGFGNSISNLLNLSDGLLSDALNLKVICTFNSNLKNIDKAVLRKGRLRARYEFRELEPPKVAALLEKHLIKVIDPKPMTLAEIYNYNAMAFEQKDLFTRIGF